MAAEYVPFCLELWRGTTAVLLPGRVREGTMVSLYKCRQLVKEEKIRRLVYCRAATWRMIAKLEPAVDVFSMADEFDFDQPLVFQHRVNKAVVACNSNAVANAWLLSLQLLAAWRKGVSAKMGNFLKNLFSDLWRKPGNVLLDGTAVFDVPTHARNFLNNFSIGWVGSSLLASHTKFSASSSVSGFFL